MITINGKIYDKGGFEADWGKFVRYTKEGRKEGIPPRLIFYVDEGPKEKGVLIELSYTEEEFASMPLGEKADLKSEVTDVLYEDENGWLTLTYDASDLHVTRLDGNKYAVKFAIGDESEELAIEIDDEFILDLPSGSPKIEVE